MRVERLVIEAGCDTFTLDLHPRLTVVAGMGRVERQSLLAELTGALGGSRPGVHVEVQESSGRHLAVFRPTKGRPRVVDVDAARDVTSELSGPDGRCDLLARVGLDPTRARRLMRFGPEDLVTDSERDRAVQELAGLDQRRLWAAATALQTAEGDLTHEAELLGSAPEDAALIEAVEARHQAVERAAARLDGTRRRTFVVAAAAGGLTLPSVLLAGAAGLAFVPVAVAAVVASLMARMRLGRAVRAEADALAETGATTYLGFQLQRVNSLLGDDAGRQVVMDVAEARREALAAWRQIAGDIPVDWALEQREEIQAAARLRREVDALGSIGSTPPGISREHTDELAHAIVTRLAATRTQGGEGVPLLLDDPFTAVDPSVKPILLELLGRSSGEPQIVLLTEDEDVASWARLEALTGEVAIIEPRTTPAVP